MKLLAFLALFAAYQLPQGVGMPPLMLLFLPVAWLVGRKLGHPGFSAWYLDLRAGWLALLAAMFALAVCAKAAALGAGAALHVYSLQPLDGATAAQAATAVPVTLFMTFFPSIAEDIVTRGFLLRAAPDLGRTPLFIAASALLFALNHIYRLANGPVEWLMLFCFGLAYAAALYYSGSLWAALGLHWGWNFAGQYTDRVVDVQAINGGGPLVSAAAHLALLGIIWLLAARGSLRKRAAA